MDEQGREWKIYFPNPKAALPVRHANEIEWLRWGRRSEEDSHGFIQGGWARHSSVLEGKWDRFKPDIVRLAVQSFMEKDSDRTSHWIDLEPETSIEALIAHVGDEARVYVITEETPPEYAWVHDRWPKLIRQTEWAG